ncbi:NAD(P)-dependent oxidoreductase [Streptomyces sp. CMB-StM0423]|uniref:NAD(P)-dependent oxidoreductase n=1 Tax=Streptomyces sp. CMB-StM0423 TaxID=2059884 RepID=UPI000C709B34|nr:NAD(P)H-binding protein [Streptomyces sp. CMB-StM0423]AUH43801.1 NAD-binding protein [Streptomyces sp. CMB-StM0423]
MGRIVVYGAGGRAGRRAVAEARRRGHEVVAVVRDPAKHAGVAGEGVRLMAGDAADVEAVAATAAGSTAAISAAAVYGEGTDPDAFFRGSAKALVAGLGRAEVPRLVLVGLASLLPDATGRRMLDDPAFPAEFRPFCEAHAAGLDILRTAPQELDWLYVSPAGDFDHDAGRTEHGYRVHPHGDAGARISYPDFAVALLDEAESPRHSRTHLAVTEAL